MATRLVNVGGLIFVGLGLSGLNDITLSGLDAVRSADVVFAEFYTSLLMGAQPEDLAGLAGKSVRILGRDEVERQAEQILEAAHTRTVAFLVVGDPMSATTHHDLRLRAEERGILTRVIPGVSIFTVAPAVAGLQIYKMGRTTTVPFPFGEYLPESPYDAIKENKARGLHTLVLFDIQAEEERFMSVPQAVAILELIERKRREGVITPQTMIVGIARAGAPDQRVLYATAEQWRTIDLGPPLHCLIVPGSLHFMEENALARSRPGASQTRSA